MTTRAYWIFLRRSNAELFQEIDELRWKILKQLLRKQENIYLRKQILIFLKGISKGKSNKRTQIWHLNSKLA